MRVLVLSDSHGNYYKLRDAILQQPTARAVVLLGDGEKEMNDIEDEFCSDNLKFYRVCGNCDWASRQPASRIEIFGGKRFYCTHGFVENVKYGYEDLKLKARDVKADVALFGHTHTQYSDYEDGLYIFNPGSISRGEYGYVDVVPGQGIICVKMKLR